MIGPNPYGPPGRENGIGYMCGRKELYDGVKKVGPFFNGVLKKGEKNRCVENMFDIIQSGNYDLVGMQEYVHTWPYGDDNHPVYSDKMKTLKNMKLVKHEVNHGGIGKMIEIASLINKSKFEYIHSEVADFKIEKYDWKKKELLPGRHDDGRPVQAILLQDKQDKNYIIFLNAHFPQTPNILWKGSSEERAKHVSGIMTELVQRLIKNSGANNSAVNNNYEIILASDTNDAELEFIKFIEINGKKMYLGEGLSEKHTCCTPLVKDIVINDEWIKNEIKLNNNNEEDNMHSLYNKVTWKKGDTIKRNGPRIEQDGVIGLRRRYGDVIMYSGDGIFEYQFPEEKKDEPYSDHAPIAAVLTPKAESVGGKKRTRKKRKRKRKKTKKRRRKKSTKKKKKRRRRKKTKKRR